jgi:hypothetical protein
MKGFTTRVERMPPSVVVCIASGNLKMSTREKPMKRVVTGNNQDRNSVFICQRRDIENAIVSSESHWRSDGYAAPFDTLQVERCLIGELRQCFIGHRFLVYQVEF